MTDRWNGEKLAKKKIITEESMGKDPISFLTKRVEDVASE